MAELAGRGVPVGVPVVVGGLLLVALAVAALAVSVSG